ncbi:hypothetical protein SAMN05216338_10298 [Bradyrhizobium sp. Rc2d]|nr:hypothetical protein SAMN05216338_10298 [Bradyrhizobium sp. Rc2d]
MGRALLVGDGLAKDRGIEQRLAPDGKPESGPPSESGEQFAMRDEGDRSRPQRTQPMIHLINEQALRVRKIAGEMEREILPPPAAEQMVAGDHAGDDQRRMFGFVALTDEILVRHKVTNREGERPDFGDILLRQRGVLPQVPDQHVVGFIHAAAKIAPVRSNDTSGLYSAD